MCCSATAAQAYDAELAWAPVSGATGYKIYVRVSSSPFGAGTDVGSPALGTDGQVHAVVSDLDHDVIHFFAVTAYDDSGMESARSNELSLMVPMPSPTAADTPTITATPTWTPTNTATIPPTSTRTATATNTPTFTATFTATPADTATRTYTPTATNTATPQSTATATATATATRTATASVTRTATPANTATRTSTASATHTVTRTPTFTASATATPADTATRTYTATATFTATPPSTSTATRTATPTATSTATPVDTATRTYTATASFTATPIDTATRTYTQTVTFTATPVDTATRTSSPTATFTTTASSTPTATRTPTETATATASAVNTATRTHTATATFTATPPATATLTATYTPTFTASPTNTAVDTATRTATASPTPSSTSTNTLVPTATRTATPTASSTATPVDTATRTSTRTATQTATPPPTNTATASRTPTFTSTASPSPSATRTATPTNTLAPTGTHTPTASVTLTATPSQTRTATRTATASFTASASPTPTATPLPAWNVGMDDDLSVMRDASVIVPVHVSSGSGLRRFALHIAFDPEVVAVEDVQLSAAAGAGQLTVDDDTPGELDLAGTLQQPMIGAGSLVDVTFTALGSCNDESALDLTVCLLDDGAIGCLPNDGLVEVTCGVAGRIRHRSSGMPVDGATVALMGMQGAVTDTTDLLGQFDFTPPLSGTWHLEPRKNGDARDAVSALDAALALQDISGFRRFDSEERMTCDVTGNGQVTALDAVRILQYAVGELDRLPISAACASDWAFFPEPGPPDPRIVPPHFGISDCQLAGIVFDPLHDDVSQEDFSGAVFGDCSGNWISPAQQGQSRLRASRHARIRLGTPRPRDGQWLVPLYVASGVPFIALDARIRHDSGATLTAIRPSGIAHDAMLRFHADGRGEARLGMASAVPMLARGGPIAVLVFDAPRQRSAAGMARLVSAALDEGPIELER